MPIMQQSPASLLFPGYRRRVLSLLLLHPEEALHGREVARRTGLAAGTITRELQRLAEAGFLESERRGNQVLYRANRALPIFEELASILRKTTGAAEVLAEALSTLGGSVAVAFVYGSMARGRETAGSDVDVMVIGEASFREVSLALQPAQASIGREINPKVFRTREWRERVSGRDPFVADVLGKPKIFVVGSEDELEKLGGNEPRRSGAVARDDRPAAGRGATPARRRKRARR